MMALRIPLQLGLRKNGVEAGDCDLSSIWRRGISYPLNWLEVLLTAKRQDQIQTPFNNEWSAGLLNACIDSLCFSEISNASDLTWT